MNPLDGDLNTKSPSPKSGSDYIEMDEEDEEGNLDGEGNTMAGTMGNMPPKKKKRRVLVSAMVMAKIRRTCSKIF